MPAKKAKCRPVAVLPFTECSYHVILDNNRNPHDRVRRAILDVEPLVRQREGVRALFFSTAVSISHSQLKNDYVAATKANNADGRRFEAIFYWQPIKFMSGAGVFDPGLTESGGV